MRGLRVIKRLVRNKWLWLAVLLAAGLAAGQRYAGMKKKRAGLVTYTVQRQNLVISVTEGGSLTAFRSLKIVNKVPGSRNILSVVDEGVRITEEGVRAGEVLMTLDSKDIEDRIQQMEITVENSLASYTEAQQNLEIQRKQNDNDIQDAELKVSFARMDLEKYLGQALAEEALKSRGEDVPKLLEDPRLGGQALNTKRDMDNKISLAREEIARTKDRLEWSEKLGEKGYVTKSELEADRLAYQQKQVVAEQAGLDQQLFLKYDFPKTVARLVADYRLAQTNLEKVRTQASSRMIQSEATVKSRRVTHILNQKNLAELRQQLADCTIRATQPGFVTYATSDRPWASSSPIQPGTTVRQYQELLNLPDFASMGVEAKIHESAVEKVSAGQKVIVQVDAFPDRVFSGKVDKIALMPDPTLKFLNPDVNVYVVRISLDDSYDFLKPGMSARVQIFIRELPNVIAVPLTAVTSRGGKTACVVLRRGNQEYRTVELGESNEVMAEVRSGLKEGETVLLQAEMVSPEVKKQPAEESIRLDGGRSAAPEPPAGGSGETPSRPRGRRRDSSEPAANPQ